MHRHRIVASLGLALLCLCAACNGDKRFKSVYPVRGMVLYEGKAPVGATVKFHPVGMEFNNITKPGGEVGEDGEFTISTYKSDDGAPEGEYDVTIMWVPKDFTGPAEQGNKLPAKYADRKTSNLKVEVKRGENVLPRFVLTK